MSGLGNVMRAVAITAEWGDYRDRRAPGETVTAFKKRRSAWRAHGQDAAASAKPFDGQAARLAEALPPAVRVLMDRGRVSRAMGSAAARFIIDYRTGYLRSGSVNYGERVQGGGGWDEGRALSGQAARQRAADAMTAMRPLPAACAKAVLIDGVSLSAAGAGSGYAGDKQQRSYAVGLLEVALDELVRFYS